MRASGSAVYTQAYDRFVGVIRSSIGAKGITFENCVILFVKAMEVAEQVRRDDAELLGTEKAELAAELISHILEDLKTNKLISEELHSTLDSIVKSPVGTMIIFSITSLASKGKVLINQWIEKIKKDGCCPKKT